MAVITPTASPQHNRPASEAGTTWSYGGGRGVAVSPVRGSWRGRDRPPGLRNDRVGIRVHDLRHAAASLAFEAGASVKEVQATLRHASQVTTADVYVHVMESVLQGTASRMDNVLKRVLNAS